jgi:hypothetical protein
MHCGTYRALAASPAVGSLVRVECEVMAAYTVRYNRGCRGKVCMSSTILRHEGAGVAESDC